jgi:hypothetical protein
VRRIAALAAVAVAAGCGSGSDDPGSREEAVRSHLGSLRGARVACEEKRCSVTAPMRLSSVYTATLVAAPVIDGALGDPDLDDLETISVTLDDADRQQVFSLECDTGKLRSPVTPESLRAGCHSIFT